MKVTELQINDLVGYNGIIGRVYATSMPFPRKEERYNDKAIITLAVDGFIDALESEVEPVYLTAEMLWKNFPDPDIVEWYPNLPQTAYNIHIEQEDVTVDVLIRYVHELQQALRLCGLKDLADNFKI